MGPWMQFLNRPIHQASPFKELTNHNYEHAAKSSTKITHVQSHYKMYIYCVLAVEIANIRSFV